MVAGSPVLDDLRDLSAQGIAILACGTCLGHYGLKDQVAVGEISKHVQHRGDVAGRREGGEPMTREAIRLTALTTAAG